MAATIAAEADETGRPSTRRFQTLLAGRIGHAESGGGGAGGLGVAGGRELEVGAGLAVAVAAGFGVTVGRVVGWAAGDGSTAGLIDVGGEEAAEEAAVALGDAAGVEGSAAIGDRGGSRPSGAATGVGPDPAPTSSATSTMAIQRCSRRSVTRRC
jgi:hypothetical protein